MNGLHHLRAWWDGEAQRRAVEIVREICADAPLRRPSTPGGHAMRVRITSAGAAGWWADSEGYRYIVQQLDGRPWPEAPAWFLEQARAAAERCGCAYEPDAVLINWYDQDASLSMHRDESEEDLEQPIVSFSLGAPATFHLRGEERDSPISQRLVLESGDAMVLAMPARGWYHAVPQILEHDPLFSPLRGAGRISILVRRVRR